jgi:hypothetical protein
MLGLGALHGGSQRPSRPRDQERRASLLHAATSPARSHPGSFYPNASKKGEADGDIGKRAAESPLRFLRQSTRFRDLIHHRDEPPRGLARFCAFSPNGAITPRLCLGCLSLKSFLATLTDKAWPLRLCLVCPSITYRNSLTGLDAILGADVQHLDSTPTRRRRPHLRSVGLRTPRRATSSSHHSAPLRLVFGACPFGWKEA